MKRLLLAAMAALLATAPTGAAIVHDLLGGGDAGSGRDAENACQPGRPPAVQAPYGDSYGQLTPLIDTEDHYLVRVQPFQRMLMVTMDPTPPTTPLGVSGFPVPNYDLGVKGWDCQDLPGAGTPNPSQNGGGAEERVQVVVPFGMPYLVVRVFSAAVPLAGDAADDPLAKAGLSAPPRGGGGCYPLCYKTTIAAG